MTIKPLTQVGETVSKALSTQAKLRKPSVKFFTDAITMYLTITDKINFLQMSRYGKFCWSTYRQNFKKSIDWLKFDMSLLPDKIEDHLRAIDIDPSYISKSGKKTPGLAYFWSGCAGAAEKGLEILGFAYVDVDIDGPYEKDLKHSVVFQEPLPKWNYLITSA